MDLENQLKKHQNLFQSVLEIIPDMISIHDPDYNIIYSNWNGFANVPEEKRIIGEKCYKTYRNNNDICPDCQTKHILKTKKPIALDYNINKQWLHVKAIPILDKNNNIEFIVEWVCDITDRKKNEESLKTQNSLLKIQQETSLDGILFVDHNDNIISFNQRFCDIWNIPDEIMQSQSGGKALEYVLSQLDNPEEFVRKINDIYKNKEEEFFDQIRLKDGKILERHTSPTNTEDKYFGRIWYYRDITKQKKQENKLLLHSLVLDQIQDRVTITDFTGKITYVNQSEATAVGIPKKELIGESIEVFGENTISQKEILENTLKNKWWRGEVTNFDQNGNEIILDLRTHTIYDTEGTPIALCGISTNITEQKKSEENLLEAKKEAEVANVAKSEFLANMSHEIRTPLNGIKGMFQLLNLRNVTKEEQQEYIELGIQSTDRLTRLLSDILDLSKIEVNKMEIRQERVCAQKLCDSVKELFTFTSQEKEIPITFEISERISKPFISDETRIQQILFNLIGNALKFTHEGQIDVFMDLLNNNFKKSWMLITVSDTGIGMSEEELDRLFEPFTQAENVYTRQFQGAGLGLTIVGKIVKILGGSIIVESEKGVGTTFYVSFPIQKYQLTGRKKINFEEKDVRTLRILVAEDDINSQFVIKRQLENLGHNVVIVENGQQAIDMVERQQFDCILMDVRMSVMDGVEATKKIKEKIDIDIIALTAHAMKGDEEKFLKEGMDGYLSKPLEYDDLVRVLGRFFGK